MKLSLNTILCGDSLKILKTLPDNSVHCCVTSPPYYGLRDYGMAGQIGREPIPEQYIVRLVEIFRDVRRVLRADGTLWLNIADSYAGSGKGRNADGSHRPDGKQGTNRGTIAGVLHKAPSSVGCKPKDLMGIPWMLAFALRQDGWYWRSDSIWMKNNPMPESVKDRPTRCYEHVFLLSKSRRYFYDWESVAEPVAASTPDRMRHRYSDSHKYGTDIPGQRHQTLNSRRPGGYAESEIPQVRNRRDVWLINTVPYKGGHFAAFPPKLAETCILAGCPEGGLVLDPFFGSGTTGLAAKRLNRHYIGIELNPLYCEMAKERMGGDLL